MGFEKIIDGPTGDRLSVIIQKCNQMFAELYSWFAEPLRNVGYGLQTIYPGCAGILSVDLLGRKYQTYTMTRNITIRTINRLAGRSASLRLVNASSSAYQVTFEAGTRFLNKTPTSIAAGHWAVISFTAYGPDADQILAVYAEQLDAPVTNTTTTTTTPTTTSTTTPAP